jgi:molybdopterin synthase sulfur carrier subunit
MAVTIKLPTPLRRHADQAKLVEVTAATVEDALGQLTGRYPAMRESIYKADGQVKPFVRVFVGGTDIADLAGLKTALQDGDEISIIPPVAGA